MSIKNQTTVAISADHAGYQLKEAIKNAFKDTLIFIDFGTNSEDSMDYPDVAHPMAEAVESAKADWGIAICGSGNGINMTVNKHQNIRSALCWRVDLAELARQHNNANVLALPARFISKELALDIVKTFANTTFEGGRHERRVDKICM
ncbi:MAG: RpiB/LacA/LacB family sugar-phosphate isomerase [Cryomorphaceae bacterium]|nr:RpiB/LacA/LacB family sugar-phosphate isomerase [Cryomorphaceae bacterium]